MAKPAWCNQGWACPRVFETDGGDVVVQGYGVDRAAVPASAAPPPGEDQVRMPREAFLAFARSLEARGTPESLGALMEGFRYSAFRLETLPEYEVEGEAERFRAFCEGEALPERSADTDSWLAYLAETTASGQRWQRVHVVTHPLTRYLRYELLSYRESSLVGQDTLIADRNDHPELAELTEDFWLLDGDEPTAFAVLMRYDPYGRFLGAWRTNDPPVVEQCRRRRDLAVGHSVALEVYVRAMEGGREPVTRR